MKGKNQIEYLRRIFSPMHHKAAWINYFVMCSISCFVYFIFGGILVQLDNIQNIYVDHANNMSRKHKSGVPVYKDFKDIVLLQINDSVPKRDVIDIVERLTHYEPSVIGVDILFEEKKKQPSDTVLHELYKRNGNIVLAYDIKDNKVDLGHLIKSLDEPNIGYLNLGDISGLVTHLDRYSNVKGNLKPSFATKIAELYLNKRIKENGSPLIDYQIIFDQYSSDFIDESVLMSCKGKVVIIGYQSCEDVKKTAYGDYYGDIIQACSVATIINDELNPIGFYKKYLLPVLCICLYILVVVFVIHCFLNYYRILFLKDFILFIAIFVGQGCLLMLVTELDYYSLQIYAAPFVSSLIGTIYINTLLLYQRFTNKECNYLNFWSKEMC